jgi:O-antigen/teichoic acid export membrane protein
MRRLSAARLLRGHGWAVGPSVTSVAASGTAAATTLVIARGIGAAAFGHFTVVLTIALIVTVGMLMSLHFVMYQQLPRARPPERPALVTTALFSTLVLAGAVVAAGLLASRQLTALFGVDFRTLCFALALALALTVNQLTESFLRGLRKFAFVAALKLAVAVAYLAAASFCLLVLGVRDAELYLVALIGMYLVFAAMAVTGFEIVPRSFSTARARAMYRHGAYVTAIAALVAVLFGVDLILLNHLADRADVGVYSVYNGLPRRLLVVVLTEGVGVVLLPTMATADKPDLLRRIGRLSPAVGTAMAVFSFAASAVFFLLLRAEYPYSPGLMALSSVGIGAHTVFHLYLFALSMDGVRGARVLIACLAAGLPVVLACQAAFIAWWGMVGAMVAFALSNVLLVGVVVAATVRIYRPAGATRVGTPAGRAAP